MTQQELLEREREYEARGEETLPISDHLLDLRDRDMEDGAEHSPSIHYHFGHMQPGSVDGREVLYSASICYCLSGEEHQQGSDGEGEF